MYRQLFLFSVIIGLCSFVSGCGKQDPEELAIDTIARADLSDLQAVEELAFQVFRTPEVVSVSKVNFSDIALTVTVHYSKEPEVLTLKKGSDAAEMDVSHVLGRTILDGRRMVQYGRQRNLAQLTINVRHTLLDEAGNKIDVDIFGYTLTRNSFDEYLTTGSIVDIVKGKALSTIEKTCKVEYNYFDQITYTNKDK